MNSSITLSGCGTRPISKYLKALGILKTFSRGTDNKITGKWENDEFVVSASRDALVNFFLNNYEPSPILAPWNGRSGFFGKTTARKTLAKITNSSDQRLDSCRDTIQKIEAILSDLGIREKTSSDNEKQNLLSSCRSKLSDEAVAVMDSLIIMLSDRMSFPPIFGSGGNDGSMDFGNNFMQRVVQVFGLGSKNEAELSPRWLENSLFGNVIPELTKAKIGQFDPGNAGGANATTGFDSEAWINPWDYILMMEGAILFAGAATKRLATSRSDGLAFPFCVRQSGSGFGTGSLSDEGSSVSRGEMWMPIWETPTTLLEIEHLFSEGRAEVNGRPASNGVDFTRAVVSLGVDRGITEFQRYGFLVRNGLAYFATPLDRVRVKRNPDADLIAEIDPWLSRFRRKAKQENPSPPSSMTRALRRIENGIIRFCKSPEPANAQVLFIALGEGEKALNTSVKWAEENFLKPLGGLSARWIKLSDDGTPEFRLAASLGSMISRFGNEWMPLRSHLEPVRSSRKGVFWKPEAHRDVMWHDGEFVDVMNRILRRRLLMETRVDGRDVVHSARVVARQSDIAKFIEKRTDDAKIAKLLWAMVLVDFPTERIQLKFSDEAQFDPSSIFALLRSCFPRAGDRTAEDSSETPNIPLSATIHRRAADRQGTEASLLAARRLHASGLRPAVSEIAFEETERIAAAMLFPLSRKAEAKLLKSIQRPSKEKDKQTENKDSEPQSITIQTTN